jgi:two-component system, NarL family, sensor histidine kinase EvgS
MALRFRKPSLGMRHQLWGLFGLFLLAGATVLIIDELVQYQARVSLETLRDNSLQRLRHLKAVSDGYGLDVVDTTFRVRNDLMTWNQGVATLDAARVKIDRSWRALAPMPRSPEQKALFEQVLVARVRAHQAMDTLRAILVRRDIRALGRFADTELYPAIDPVTTRMEALSNLAMQNSERMVREDIERGRRAISAASCATSTRAWSR